MQCPTSMVRAAMSVASSDSSGVFLEQSFSVIWAMASVCITPKSDSLKVLEKMYCFLCR